MDRAESWFRLQARTMPILLLLLLTSHIILLSHCNPDHLEPPSISLLSYSEATPIHYLITSLCLSSHPSHLLTISLVCVRFSFHPPPQSSLPIFLLLLRSHSHPITLTWNNLPNPYTTK